MSYDFYYGEDKDDPRHLRHGITGTGKGGGTSGGGGGYNSGSERRGNGGQSPVPGGGGGGGTAGSNRRLVRQNSLDSFGATKHLALSGTTENAFRRGRQGSNRNLNGRSASRSRSRSRTRGIGSGLLTSGQPSRNNSNASLGGGRGRSTGGGGGGGGNSPPRSRPNGGGAKESDSASGGSASYDRVLAEATRLSREVERDFAPPPSFDDEDDRYGQYGSMNREAAAATGGKKNSWNLPSVDHGDATERIVGAPEPRGRDYGDEDDDDGSSKRRPDGDLVVPHDRGDASVEASTLSSEGETKEDGSSGSSSGEDGDDSDSSYDSKSRSTYSRSRGSRSRSTKGSRRSRRSRPGGINREPSQSEYTRSFRTESSYHSRSSYGSRSRSTRSRGSRGSRTSDRSRSLSRDSGTYYSDEEGGSQDDGTHKSPLTRESVGGGSGGSNEDSSGSGILTREESMGRLSVGNRSNGGGSDADPLSRSGRGARRGGDPQSVSTRGGSENSPSSAGMPPRPLEDRTMSSASGRDEVEEKDSYLGGASGGAGSSRPRSVRSLQSRHTDRSSQRGGPGGSVAASGSALDGGSQHKSEEPAPTTGPAAVVPDPFAVMLMSSSEDEDDDKARSDFNMDGSMATDKQSDSLYEAFPTARSSSHDEDEDENEEENGKSGIGKGLSALARFRRPGKKGRGSVLERRKREQQILENEELEETDEIRRPWRKNSSFGMESGNNNGAGAAAAVGTATVVGAGAATAAGASAGGAASAPVEGAKAATGADGAGGGNDMAKGRTSNNPESLEAGLNGVGIGMPTNNRRGSTKSINTLTDGSILSCTDTYDSHFHHPGDESMIGNDALEKWKPGGGLAPDDYGADHANMSYASTDLLPLESKLALEALKVDSRLEEEQQVHNLFTSPLVQSSVKQDRYDKGRRGGHVDQTAMAAAAVAGDVHSVSTAESNGHATPQSGARRENEGGGNDESRSPSEGNGGRRAKRFSANSHKSSMTMNSDEALLVAAQFAAAQTGEETEDILKQHHMSKTTGSDHDHSTTASPEQRRDTEDNRMGGGEASPPPPPANRMSGNSSPSPLGAAVVAGSFRQQSGPASSVTGSLRSGEHSAGMYADPTPKTRNKKGAGVAAAVGAGAVMGTNEDLEPQNPFDDPNLRPSSTRDGFQRDLSFANSRASSSNSSRRRRKEKNRKTAAAVGGAAAVGVGVAAASGAFADEGTVPTAPTYGDASVTSSLPQEGTPPGDELRVLEDAENMIRHNQYREGVPHSEQRYEEVNNSGGLGGLGSVDQMGGGNQISTYEDDKPRYPQDVPQESGYHRDVEDGRRDDDDEDERSLERPDELKGNHPTGIVDFGTRSTDRGSGKFFYRYRFCLLALLVLLVTVAVVVPLAILLPSREQRTNPPTGEPTAPPIPDPSWEMAGSPIDGLAAGDTFGSSVSMSSSGKRLAAGSSRSNVAGTDSGSVRIFQLGSAGDWTQVGSEIPGMQGRDFAGYSVSLSGDGQRVAIGSRFHSSLQGGAESGQARVFEFNSGRWEQIGGDINGEAQGDEAGFSVSLSEDGFRLAVGAWKSDARAGIDSGSVRVFEFSQNDWNQVGSTLTGSTVEELFGMSVSLSSNGSILAVGAPKSAIAGEDSGEVRVFAFAGDWTQMGDPLPGRSGAWFGRSLSLSLDGARLAVGAFRASNGSGLAQVFNYDISGRRWTQVGEDIVGEVGSQLGGSISMNHHGDRFVVGADRFEVEGKEEAGQVQVYALDGSFRWSRRGTPILGGAFQDRLGNSVTMSADGNFIGMGVYGNDSAGPNAGQVQAYQWYKDAS